MNTKIHHLKAWKIPFLIIIIAFAACERDVLELQAPTFPTAGEVFTDTFINMGSNFYFPFVGDGAKPDVFSVDNTVGYNSKSSIRIDVPNADDPAGNFAGAYFRIDGTARDLSSYNALTFYVKASQGVKIDNFGFGINDDGSRYQVSITNVGVGTGWSKVIIPIPDPSKLTYEKGVFWFSTGTLGTNGLGYAFWIDELKFENIEALNNPRPFINSGNDDEQTAFIGTSLKINNLGEKFNLPTGVDQSMTLAPSYFTFMSSDTDIATVDALGNVTVVGEGSATITAKLNGVDAKGSVKVKSLGKFEHAPVPTQDAANVISIFSDAYENRPVDFYNGYYAPYQTTTSADFTVAKDNVLNYLNFNFVGIEFNQNVPQINASGMSFLHLDVFIPGTLPADPQLRIDVIDYGNNGTYGGDDDLTVSQTFDGSILKQGQWVGLDVPITTLNPRTKVSQIIIATPGGLVPISNLYVDNIYFYNGSATTAEPTTAAPTPTKAASDVVSLFSDTYTDVAVDTFLTDWSSATLSDFSVAGNASKKYSNLDFAGIETTTKTVDASAMTHLHVDIWTPNATQFSIKLVDFGADGVFGNGDDVEQQLDFPNPTQNSWVSYDVPLKNFTNLTTKGHLAQYIIVAQPTGVSTVFVDNFYFYKGDVIVDPNGPAEAAPTPKQPAADVISLFSDTYTDVTVDTFLTDWSNSGLEDKSVNGNAIKEYTNLNFAGIETTTNTIDASAMDYLHVDIWTADATQFSIKLVDFGANGVYDGGGDDVEHQLDFASPTQGSWVSYNIPLTDFTGLTTKAHIAQYILVAQPSGAANVYIDNLYFYKDNGGTIATEPTVAAPTPTKDANKVVSLFSDAYTDVTVDTFLTTWSNAKLDDVTVADNATKKYSNLDFAGIETVANTVDASAMTHLHVDIWSADATKFSIKLVDFGADGIFGNGDDVEQQLDYENPTQGSWVSYDIPLSDFTNLTTRAHLAQYIIVAQPTAATTVYMDNLYFYNDDASTSTEPTTAAPDPTLPASNVISLFSDTYTDVAVDTYLTTWSSATIEDFTVDGNATKKYVNLDFAGIETTTTTVDASAMNHLHIDVWTADATQFSIKLVDFGADGVFGGGDDVEQQLDYANPTQNTWVSYNIPLSDFTNLTTKAHLAQYILVAQPTGAANVYIDNMYFYNDDVAPTTAPTTAAPTPTTVSSDVVSLFSDAYTDVTVDTFLTDWSQGTLEDVAIAGNATKKYSSLDFAGIETVTNTVNASAMTHLHVDVWTPDATQFSIKLVDFGADGVFGGGDDVEQQIDYANPTQSSWISYDIPLSDFTGLTTKEHIAQYILVAQPSNSATIYIDNFYFYNDNPSVVVEPLTPAPTPTVASANAISIFSDAYSDVTVDTYLTSWSSASIEDATIDGNAAKKYTNLDFAGIETTTTPVDASAMTHFHVDIWTADATQFSIKLVDFGADGVFGGGDDVEQQLDYPSPTQDTWVSYDIPLSDFTNLTTKGHIAQYILVAQPTGAANVYMDNMYFYNDGAVATNEPTTPAPTPTVAATDAISLFSDAYTDVTVDTFLTSWSNATIEDFAVDGNATKKYANLDFAGIETVANTVDASAMTHLHVDFWSADATQFSIKLVDFGGDGVFGGGDDVEQQLDYPNPTQNSWVSYDIPLSDFTNLTTRAHLAQYILVAQPTGAANVYIDNMYFYTDGSNVPTGPTTAAPTPTVAATDAISLFSDAYTDVTVDTYLTSWSNATIEDLTVEGNATKKYANLDFAGIETTSTPVDASGMTHLHVDVWSADATQFSIKLVDFGSDGVFGGGDDVEQQLDYPNPTQNSWVSYDIPLSDFTNLTTRAHLAQYILVAQPTGAANVYIDNMYFYTDGSNVPTGPTTAAPTPTVAATDAISLFSDAYSDVSVDTFLTSWSSGTLEDLSIDGNATKKYANLDFAGIETTSTPVDASGMTHLHVDMWTADATQFSIKLVDFGADGAFGGGDDVEQQINYPNPTQETWVSYDIPLSDFTNLTTRGHIAQYILVAQPSGAANVYIDNLYFYDDGSAVATAPTTAAPTPIIAAADAISIFSDAYTNTTVDTYLTPWSSSTIEDFAIGSDNTKKYGNLDFAGIETVANTVNASSMTHLHVDIWTADATQFSIKLVDFGANGVYDGGDDTFHQIDYPNPTQGAWISYDIPLSDFTGLVNKEHIAQYILVGQPTGNANIYMDNLYFYNDGSATPTAPTSAAPTPTIAATNAISLFSDSYTDVAVDTYKTDWSQATLEDFSVDGNATKKYSNLNFAGITTETSTVNASGMTHLHVDVWTPDATQFRIKLVDYGANGVYEVGGDNVEHELTFNNPTQGSWNSYDIPLSDFTGLTTREHLAQYIVSALPAGSATVFIDNLYFYNDGSVTPPPTVPTVAATAPTLPAANVISVFSDAYTNTTVDTYLTSWSVGTMEDFSVAGDNTKKYVNLNYAGISTETSQIDASAMTHFHIDIWTADATQFGIKLVDFGADGAYQGGDDVEYQINYPNPTQGTWVSYDIPLSDFTGLTTKGHIAQFVLVGVPGGASNIYVDNMYFHN